LAAALRRTWPWTTFAIAAVSLWLPFANYGFSPDLIGGDANSVWALPREALSELLGVFVDHPALGRNAAGGLAGAFPTLTVAASLHGLGLSTAIVARLMIALYYFVAIAGAGRLGRTLLSTEPVWIREVGSLSGALLYGVNHYTLHVFASAVTFFPLGYIALPWLLDGVLTGCERNPRVGVAMIGAAVVCAGGCASDPALFVVALMVLPLGALLALAEGVTPRRVLAVCGGGLALGLGLCAWWLLPALADPVADPVTRMGWYLPQSISSWIEWASLRSGFAELFKLDGYFTGEQLPFAAWYASPLGSLLGYGPFLVAIAGFGVVRRRLAAASLVLLAVLVFLAKGLHPPAAWLYGALVDHVPGFSLVQSPYEAWGQLETLVLVVLYVLGFAGLMRRFASLRPWGAAPVFGAICAVLPLLAYPWPAFSGGMLKVNADPSIAPLSSLPEDYRRVGSFLRAHSAGSRTLILNAGNPQPAVFTWGYFGEDPLMVAAGVAVTGPDAIPRAAALPPQALERALDGLGVRFVVVHDDLLSPHAGADIQTLVDNGDARLVMRTPNLRVFERTRLSASLVSLVHDPALIDGPGAHPAELAVDPMQTAQLVPNVSPEFGFPRAATLLTAAGQSVARNGTIGVAHDLFGSARPQGPSSDLLGEIPGNPLAAVVGSARCGRSDAVRLRPPSDWWIGAAHLPSFDLRFCLAGQRVGPPIIDGIPATGGVTLAYRSVHQLEVREAVRRGWVRAHRLVDDGLTFSFVAPFVADVLEVSLPPELAGLPLAAAVYASDDSGIGSVFADEPSRTLFIALTGRRLVRGEQCFLDFHATDHRLWPAVRRVAALLVALATTKTERRRFAIGADAISGRPLAAADVGRPMRERANPDLAATRLNPQLAWSALGTKRGMWRALPVGVDLHPGRGPAAARGVGYLILTDRYRWRFVYRASADSALTLGVDGYVGARSVPLIADGRPHVADEPVYPPTGSTGRISVTARTVAGDLKLRHTAFELTGPNALVYALQPGHAGGRLLGARRLTPWWFEARVEDCAPCVLRIAVSGPQHWLVRGARVLGTYEAAGQSTGMPWSSAVSGAATWLLDGGSGARTVDVIFVPALLAGAGVLFSLTVLGLGIALLRRLPSSATVPTDGPSGAHSRTAAGARVAALLLAVVLATAGGLPSLSIVVGSLLWMNVLFLGLWTLGK
jgi:hypothetical protein